MPSTLTFPALALTVLSNVSKDAHEERVPLWVTKGEHASNYVLTALYAVVALYAGYALFGRSHPKTRMIRMFCFVLTIGCIARILYFGIPESAWKITYVPKNTKCCSFEWKMLVANFIVFAAGNSCFYAEFSLIVYFWAEAYYSTRRQQVQRRPFQYFTTCVVGYIIVQILMVFLFSVLGYDRVLSIHTALVFLLSLSVAFGFVVFWTKLSSALTPSVVSAGSFLVVEPKDSAVAQQRSKERDEKMRKITVVAVVGALCEGFRALVMVYEFYLIVFHDGRFPSKYWWIVILFFFLLSELLTSIAVLYVLRKPSRPQLNVSAPDERSEESHYAPVMTSPLTSRYDELDAPPYMSDLVDTDTQFGASEDEAGSYLNTPSILGTSAPRQQGPTGPISRYDPWESPYFTP